MKSYKTQTDMPIGELEKENGTVEHLVCQGSRRHVISYDTNGEHCSEPKCEINYKQNKKKNYLHEILRKYSRS